MPVLLPFSLGLAIWTWFRVWQGTFEFGTCWWCAIGRWFLKHEIRTWRDWQSTRVRHTLEGPALQVFGILPQFLPHKSECRLVTRYILPCLSILYPSFLGRWNGHLSMQRVWQYTQIVLSLYGRQPSIRGQVQYVLDCIRFSSWALWTILRPLFYLTIRKWVVGGTCLVLSVNSRLNSRCITKEIDPSSWQAIWLPPWLNESTWPSLLVALFLGRSGVPRPLPMWSCKWLQWVSLHLGLGEGFLDLMLYVHEDGLPVLWSILVRNGNTVCWRQLSA